MSPTRFSGLAPLSAARPMALVAIASALAAGLGAERSLAWSQDVVAEASSTAPAAAASRAKSSTRVTLAGPDEPGEPLEVSGVVYESDGKTPASGTRIFVYHTDASGHYSEGGQDREKPRLSAELVTGADGKYSFRTILPGYYPGGGTPRHIHYEITARDGRATSAEMRFADDPKLSKSTLDRAREAIGRGDRFFDVRPVERGTGGIKHCAFDLRLPPQPARAPRAAG